MEYPKIERSLKKSLKVKEEDRKLMRFLAERGFKVKDLAKIFEISKNSVRCIILPSFRKKAYAASSKNICKRLRTDKKFRLKEKNRIIDHITQRYSKDEDFRNYMLSLSKNQRNKETILNN